MLLTQLSQIILCKYQPKIRDNESENFYYENFHFYLGTEVEMGQEEQIWTRGTEVKLDCETG